MVSLFIASFFVFVSVCTIILPHHTQAHPLATPQPSSAILALSSNATQVPSSSCGFDGNADVYGPGIRIGIYTQTLAVFLTKYFVVSHAPILRDSITIFSIALISVSLVFAVHTSTTYAVEFFIVVQILSWNCLTGVRGRNSYSITTFGNRTIRVLGTEAFNMGASVLHAWFWFGGIERFERMECGTKVFFFAKAMESFKELKGRKGQEDAAKDEKDGGNPEGYMNNDQDSESIRHGTPELIGLLSKEVEPHHRLSIEETHTHIVNASAASSTWNSDSTRADDERMSQKVSWIKKQLSRAPSPEHPPLHSPNQIPEASQSTYGPSTEHRIPPFEDLYLSELFLAHYTAISSAQSQARHPTLYKNLLRLCLIPRPMIPNDSSNSPIPSAAVQVPAYTTCLKAIVKALVTFRFPRSAALAYTHLFRTRSLDPLNGPAQLYTRSHTPLPPTAPSQ
ncbi:hypothetical protein K505DRAFT_383916 [Melanomma pulvis-pyrius CBS 109.77]|uniref:DUF1753-domain-containing protein n=1 Tax=Melanomma pulvis-pyrius CBS 109.77 TaxID=1314802 RepID=A0A6A6XER4_9PLEO|nr:hypothetical protein K505DRAFT_383916 [Melanomma pulvis-pyrius CBS 109.77]